MSADNALPSASDVARDLARALVARGQEYALGGAIALGFWGEPRGTLDVDVTLSHIHQDFMNRRRAKSARKRHRNSRDLSLLVILLSWLPIRHRSTLSRFTK
jgi:hypothetical protein